MYLYSRTTATSGSSRANRATSAMSTVWAMFVPQWQM